VAGVFIKDERERDTHTGRKTPHGDTGPERRQPHGDRQRWELGGARNQGMVGAIKT